jgi:excisionase family DNA binding protein
MALRRSPEDEKQPRLLEVDASMTGSLVFKDPVNLQINGQFDGMLETKGNLAIGERAHVKATIKGEDIHIAGTVEGPVTATRRLELLATARVVGKLSTPRLTIHEGAVFQGSCEMSASMAGGEGGSMTIEDLALYLEVDGATIVDWAKSGRLPAQQANGQWQFDRRRIEEWLAKEKAR